MKVGECICLKLVIKTTTMKIIVGVMNGMLILQETKEKKSAAFNKQTKKNSNPYPEN